jgi:hypothetical protein
LLHKKIENVLPILLKNCFPESFQERWKWPKRDPDTGLYQDLYFRRKPIAKADVDYENDGREISAIDSNKLVIEVDDEHFTIF